MQQELNEARTPLLAFMNEYNRNLPQGYPSASLKALETFRNLHPLLFRGADSWSIDKHRKRVMDWLSSHNDG